MFSFKRNRQHVEVRDLLYRIVNLTSPNLAPLEGELRGDDRLNRTLPVLLAPWENEQPVTEETTTALTKDFSGRGVALVLNQPLRVERVIVGFLLPSALRDAEPGEPRFIVGHVHQNVSLGGGYWQLCIEFDEIVAPTAGNRLVAWTALTERLVPSHAAEKLPRAEAMR